MAIPDGMRSVRLDLLVGQFEKYKRAAALDGVTFSQYMRSALHAYFNRHEIEYLNDKVSAALNEEKPLKFFAMTKQGPDVFITFRTTLKQLDALQGQIEGLVVEEKRTKSK